MSDATANDLDSRHNDNIASFPSSMRGQHKPIEYGRTNAPSHVNVRESCVAQGAPCFKKYRAMYICDSTLRNLEFEARDLDEATKLATTWGFGLVGEVEVNEGAGSTQPSISKPEAYDVAHACRVLGGISRTSLYRLLHRGKLQRLPDTRKVLVTRVSIERYCARAA